MGFFDDFIKNIGQQFAPQSDARKQASDDLKKRFQQTGPDKPNTAGAALGILGKLVSPGSAVNTFVTGGGGGNSAPAPAWEPTQFKPIESAPQYDMGTTEDPSMQPQDTSGLWDRLNQEFNYGNARSQVDTSPFDQALAARMKLISDAKGQANSNFATSDANLRDMFGAVQNDVRSQAPEIKQQYADTGGDISKIFDTTLHENAADQAKQQAAKTEMLQRLGIAPAANQPDIVGEQYAKSNDAARSSRDARLGDNAIQGQVAQDRNTNFANAVGSDGVQRRSDLNQQLQTILGNLDQSGAGYQNDAINAKMNYQDKNVDQQYQQFLQNRNFDFSQLQEKNNYNTNLAKVQSDAELAAMKQAATAKDATINGFQGLWGQTPDAVKKAVMNLPNNISIEKDPEKAYAAIVKMAQKDPSINLDEAYQFINNRATLGTSNKFAAQ